ncbi:TetR/AcrR family transcriptional regulator [Pseudorhodoplanes sp.]|uniref:TetR/AcrR family transcriptional regulator n=1 Tax=Pseudorhodoplanes sp. TaxID=1934341 RepID=UPI002B7BDAE8|nr:TetR/AcrR family transcriptional regulator [Pseudorhodoplanes sp.]HWV51466.1 TetR/AcrR family transcriptional regulator [Pseudorhodoplanes sp.]
MPYRRTAQVVRKQAARHQAILAAARSAATEGGMAAVQVAAVAERAGIATGTVYRYFPSKTELITALIGIMAEREVAAIAKAGKAAPGPVSALAASIATFAARSLRQRRLVWAIIADPAEADVEAARIAFRRALADEFQARIAAAMQAGHLPAQDPRVAASALVGALLEGLVGPLAPETNNDPVQTRDAVQALTLLSLRALGVIDARARGLVVQIALPAAGDL